MRSQSLSIIGDVMVWYNKLNNHTEMKQLRLFLVHLYMVAGTSENDCNLALYGVSSFPFRAPILHEEPKESSSGAEHSTDACL